MDKFEVVARDTALLDKSHLVEEMQANISSDLFPVLIGDDVAHFHNVDGGYHRDGGYHVVNLIHETHGPGRPPSNPYALRYEAHMENAYFYLTVDEPVTMGTYPQDDFIISLKVLEYETGRYSFKDSLLEDIDRREKEVSFDE